MYFNRITNLAIEPIVYYNESQVGCDKCLPHMVLLHYYYYYFSAKYHKTPHRKGTKKAENNELFEYNGKQLLNICRKTFKTHKWSQI